LFDREELFQLLQQKDWDAIAKVMYRNSELLGSDPIIQRAITLFESEFFSETDHLDAKDKLKVYEYPSLVIDGRKNAFTDSFVSKFIEVKLELLKESKIEHLLSYASMHQNHSSAKIILAEIQNNRPEILADVRRKSVSVKSTEVNSGIQRVTNLFKSKQEQRFFEAVREAFPTYHPYPNVAVSCVLDFEKVKHLLKPEEKDYFFKAIVDSVVFDTSNGYEPKYFIELDSGFHDSERAKKKYLMKDNIFKSANVKLIRIRAYDQKEVTVQKFKKLVLEVMRDL
jgi:hypothetical protein